MKNNDPDNTIDYKGKMEPVKSLNHNLAAIGEGALLIWWGIVLLIDPITIGMGAIGSGLILLGVNAARWLTGIPTKRSTTVIGIIALVWGALDQAFALDFWPSFAMLMIVIGAVEIASLAVRPKTILTPQ